MVSGMAHRLKLALCRGQQYLLNGSDDRVFLLILPIYFLVLYWKVLFLGYIPAPVDLALYHAPWTAAQPPGWRGGSYVLSDIMDQMFPPIRMAYQAIWHGDWPFYTDRVQNGVPWLLVGRQEIFSPLLLLPVLIFGPKAGFIVAVILKFVLGTSAFIMLARAWGIGLFAATLGGLVFMANAFPVQNLGNGIGSMYYLIPVAMYGLHRVMEGRWLWTFLTPIVLLTIFCSGYPPAVAFHATLYAAYIAFWLFTNKGGRIRALAHLSCVAVAAIALVLPSLLESYYYLMKDLDGNYRTNYWARHLPQLSIGSLVMPWGFGERTSGGWTWVREAIYIGLLPLLLTMMSLFLPRKRTQYVFFACFTGYILLVLFNFYFLSHFYRYIPVLNGTNPNNQTMIFGYLMALLAMLGAEQLEQTHSNRRRVILALVAALGTLTAIVAIWFPVFSQAKHSHMVVAGLGLAAAVALVLGWQRADRKRPVQVLILVFTVTDLILMGYGFNRAVPSRLAYPETPGVAFVRDHVGDGKIFSLDTSMLADTPLWHGIRTFGGRGFFTAETKKLYRLVNDDAFVRHPTQYLFPSDDTTRLSSQILDVVNVRYLTANPGFASGAPRQWIEGYKDRNGQPKFTLVHQGDMAVFENRSALGKAFLVSDVGFGNADAIYQALQADKHDLSRFGWIDEATVPAADRAALAGHNGQPFEGRVVNEDVSNNRLSFTVTASRPALLVIGDNYHPAWRARVNGQEQTVLKVDYALRGVVVPAGESTVLLAYQPDYLTWSLPLMWATLLVLVGGAIFICARGPLSRMRQ